MRLRLCCSLVVIVAASACRPSAPEPLTPHQFARARLLRIEDTHRDEPHRVDSLLASLDPRDRASAAMTVGRIGNRAHLPALRRLATDADTAVAGNALFALGLLKDTVSASLAVNALNAGAVQGTEAAWMLGELGEHGRDAIVNGLADASLPSTTRAALLLAATRLRPVPVTAIIPVLSSPDSALAWRAAYAIARGRSAAGARALLSQSESRWPAVREQVARGASRGIAGDSLAGIARAALARLVADTSARVRINAVRSVATFGAPSRALVVAALRDADAGVRLSAAQSLDLVLDSAATSWTSAFDADTTFVMRRAVADGAVKRGINLASRASWSSSDVWQQRAAAVELAARGDAVAALDRLARLPADKDGRVRAATTAAFAALGDTVRVRDAVRSHLRRMLADDDVGVRTTSLAGLTSRATTDDLAAALVAYDLASTDRDNDARLAFWTLADSALARHAVPLPDSVEKRLRGLHRPSDLLERQAASRIERFAAWRDSIGTARPLAWYEERIRESLGTPPTLWITTDRGPLELTLFARDAPLTVYNIASLARRGYFDNQRFHRVVPNFVVQGGDPRGDGNGGPGYAIRDELNRRRYLRGTLGMALSGPNTGGSQFFVTHSPQPHLDGGYTVFGQLVRGGDVLDSIVQGDRIVRVTVH